MKKVLVGMLLGLGLVAGFGFANEVEACENNSCGEYTCALCEEQYCMEENCSVTCECGVEVFELEVDYIAEHKVEDKCTDEHILCENCGAFFCLTEDCYCGEYVVNEHYVYEEIYMNEVNEEKAVEVNVVMNYEEYYVFEEMVFDIYLEACVNACDECGYYYYEECMCEACEEAEECDECFYYDYELFIADNYEMIIDLAEEILVDIQETIEEMNQASVMYYEF